MKRSKLIPYLILVLRSYLIFYMLSYGISKLMLNQFGVHDQSIKQQPLEELDLFYIIWYAFGQSVFFNVVTGVIEIICAILLLFKRTLLIGIFITLTVLVQILVIDISFTTSMFGFALPVRILGMILTCSLIIWYYKNQVLEAIKTLSSKANNQIKYHWILILLLPLFGFLLDFIIGMMLYPLKIFLNQFL